MIKNKIKLLKKYQKHSKIAALIVLDHTTAYDVISHKLLEHKSIQIGINSKSIKSWRIQK